MPGCPQCGAELDSDNLAGLCPKCLIEGAFDSSVDSADSETQTIGAGMGPGADDDFARYHIVRPIGEGGMGTVYLAEQREPIRRLVALKVVKLGMDTAQVLARFANERQALAMMDHPNIARIFDAGATPGGRPYFVMEYIEGLPITSYCDGRRLTIGQRLELFVAVCRAAQHAHEKGVIHRDLKPSNVLVMEFEQKPVPKVIDFGIAKATNQWAVENTQLTQFGQMVGTPEYASPEQAEVMTGEVDESSDVYSLGVILYELLVGRVPFDAASMRQVGIAEMLRVIREEEAPSLSRRLTTMGAAAADVAARRQTDPASLRRLVDGDLTWITMKALEKASERRYASVAALAADIQRYLEDQPVLASPPSAVYRARKFVRRHRSVVAAAVGGLAFALLSGVTLWSLTRHVSLPRTAAAVHASKGTVVLSEFDNNTGDHSFDSTLRGVMAGELAKSPYLSVLPDERVNATLRLMLRPSDTRLTPEIASEICERTGGGAVVEGSIGQLGSQYLLALRARNCRTGDVLDDGQTATATRENILKVTQQIASGFAARAGPSVPPIEQQPNFSADVTTPSLEAWRSYNAGMKAIQRKGEPTEAISLLKRAAEIDSNFAMAYAVLGRTYDSQGETELGAQTIAKAYELRQRVSDPESYFITFNYFRQAPRNLELARQTAESWAQKYAGDYMPHSFLSAFVSAGMGHYEKAAEEGVKAIEMNPNMSISYINAAFAYVYLNRLPEATALLRKASERKIDGPEFSLCRYDIAFLGKDAAAMQREVMERKAKFQAQGWFEQQEALSLAYQGRLKEANRLSDSAVLLARQGDLRERAALFEGARAVWNALFGIPAEAQKHAAAALLLYRGRDADYGPAFAWAFLGYSAEARKIMAELEKRYPEDTSVQFSYLPALRGIEALRQRDPARAVDVTEAAAPYELAMPGTAYRDASFFGALYPIYVRGLAYSQSGRDREAAAEFQKILDHPGIVLNDPIGTMARLQLGKALSASGQKSKSAAVYKDLLSIWKDADPELPAVEEAKAEFAKQQ